MASKADGTKKPSKKPPMRTAMEVVKRIIWDDKIPESLITIGYEDRFLGILEKPFDEFSWEPLDSIDYYTFGVPEHRIQYFRYRDTIIWDKRDRLDDVFGSTGSGITIYEAMEKADVAFQMKAAAEKLLKANKALNDSDDDDDDAINVLCDNVKPKAENLSDDEVDDDEDQFWQNKLRPNFFICQRVNSPELLKQAAALQAHMCKAEPLYESCCIGSNAFHITLRTLRLDNAEQVTECVKALKMAKEELEDLVPKSPLVIRGLNNFHNRVIYAAVEPNAELDAFVDHLDLVLHSAGFTISDGRDFVPHITLVKLSRPVSRKLQCNSIDPALYADFEYCDFGSQVIDTIYLCSMEKTRDADGFYISPAHESALEMNCLGYGGFANICRSVGKADAAWNNLQSYFVPKKTPNLTVVDIHCVTQYLVFCL